MRASQLTAALLVFAATGAAAGPPMSRPLFGGPSHAPRQQTVFGFPFGFAYPYYEREVVHVIEREVVREVPAPPPPPPRDPYAVGRSYGSLPGSCMKMIADGATYFNCGGEWYREVPGSGTPYKAVAAPL